MKIRIKGNTVRYRLSKTEVLQLTETGGLKEETEFLNGSLVYAIRQVESGELAAEFSQQVITLKVPGSLLKGWADTEQVGIDGYMPLPGGNKLYLLLEKDFKCIDLATREDQSDYFENPQLIC